MFYLRRGGGGGRLCEWKRPVLFYLRRWGERLCEWKRLVLSVLSAADIDECLDNSTCGTTGVTCVNLAGGYRCDCNNGYFRLSSSSPCQGSLLLRKQTVRGHHDVGDGRDGSDADIDGAMTAKGELNDDEGGGDDVDYDDGDSADGHDDDGGGDDGGDGEDDIGDNKNNNGNL